MSIACAGIASILFDWDGTLNDSAQAGYVAFQKSLAPFGVNFTREFYETHYTPNWYRMYELLRLPREVWERADELWMEHYGAPPVRLVQNARETLFELKARGYRLGVVSSGSHCRVAREIEEAALDAIFEAVVCNDHIEHRKPHPEGLERAMREMGCASADCSYVGDAPEDIEMGRRARVLTIGVVSAFPTSKLLRAAQPDIHLNSIGELLDHF